MAHSLAMTLRLLVHCLSSSKDLIPQEQKLDLSDLSLYSQCLTQQVLNKYVLNVFCRYRITGFQS